MIFLQREVHRRLLMSFISLVPPWSHGLSPRRFFNESRLSRLQDAISIVRRSCQQENTPLNFVASCSTPKSRDCPPTSRSPLGTFPPPAHSSPPPFFSLRCLLLFPFFPLPCWQILHAFTMGVLSYPLFPHGACFSRIALPRFLLKEHSPLRSLS